MWFQTVRKFQIKCSEHLLCVTFDMGIDMKDETMKKVLVYNPG